MSVERGRRKLEHIVHALNLEQKREAGFDDIVFVHQSLPDIGTNDVNLSTTLGELSLSSPLFVNAMTGGGGQPTLEINKGLAEIAKECGIAMAVGSQMAAVKDAKERQSFEIVRRINPTGVVFANIGSEATVDEAKQAVEMIEANGLQIHLNSVQELVMPEGDRNFIGALRRIERMVHAVGVPIIVKEVGFGMSKETAQKLEEIGVTIVDVGGFGGTNFARIENNRRPTSLSYFNNWGISTAASIVEVSQSATSLSVIGSGGVRSAFDAVKAIALGAQAVGVAQLFLKVWMEQGTESLLELIHEWHKDFRLLMTALGTRTIEELRHVPLVIYGQTHHWLNERGFDTKVYSRR